MNWYKHDTNATTDAKIRKLIMKYGAEGYAIYFHCLELIAADISENNITFELEHDAEIIADNLKIKSTPDCAAIDKVNEIMMFIVNLGLFQESEGRIFCFKMLKRMDTSMTSSPKFRALIQKAKESHDAVMIHHDVVMQDKIRKDKIRKDKIRKDKIRKDKTFTPPTLEDVKDYCQQKGFNDFDYQYFYDKFTEDDWYDGYGNKVKNWKTKIINCNRYDTYKKHRNNSPEDEILRGLA